MKSKWSRTSLDINLNHNDVTYVDMTSMMCYDNTRGAYQKRVVFLPMKFFCLIKFSRDSCTMKATTEENLWWKQVGGFWEFPEDLSHFLSVDLLVVWEAFKSISIKCYDFVETFIWSLKIVYFKQQGRRRLFQSTKFVINLISSICQRNINKTPSIGIHGYPSQATV